LAITPDTGQGLLICGRIPVRVKENQSVGTDQVETASSGLAAEQEHKLVSIWIVEPVDQLLSLVDRHRAIQSQNSVSGRERID